MMLQSGQLPPTVLGSKAIQPVFLQLQRATRPAVSHRGVHESPPMDDCLQRDGQWTAQHLQRTFSR